MDIVAQVGLVLFSGLAIWFLGRREAWARWGWVFGLISEPFWLYTAIKTRQWGIVVMCMWWTYSWAQGLWNHWVKKERQKV